MFLKIIFSNKLDLFCGLYYKHVTIVNDYASSISKWVSSLLMTLASSFTIIIGLKYRPLDNNSFLILGLPIFIQNYKTWNTNWRGRLSTVDLMTKVACLVKKSKICLYYQIAADLKFLVQGGQLYWAFPQGILKGEVSLYWWPPVWLVWISLFCK